LKAQGEVLDATAATTGWHTFWIRLVNPPAANPKPSYKLTVTYQATQETVVSEGERQVFTSLPPYGRLRVLGVPAAARNAR